MEDKTKQPAEATGEDIKKVVDKIKKPEPKKVKVKLKEYDEILCKRCEHKLKVKDTLTMVDGYKGYVTCNNEDPVCRHRTHVVKTRPNDDDYNVMKTGQRVRKIPKSKLSKKDRRRARKDAISN